jgi:DNA-binding PadR family transcriptional regulator
MLDNIILGMLMKSEMSGYGLKKIIEHDIGAFYSASFGSIYPALERLKRQNYVKLTEIKNGARVKKIYSITQSGRAVFMSYLAEPIKMGGERNEHILKIYFLDFLPEKQRSLVLLEFIQKTKMYLGALEQVEKMLDTAQMGNDGNYCEFSTLYYGIEASRLTIRYCEHIRDRKPLKKLLERGPF